MIGNEFTGGNDRRNQIAVRQRFDGRLSRVEGCAIHIIRRAANIVTSTTHAASSAVSSAGTSAASATGQVALIRVWRRRESVTGRRVGAHVAAITGIPTSKGWMKNDLIDPFRDELTDQSVGYSELCGCIRKPEVIPLSLFPLTSRRDRSWRGRRGVYTHTYRSFLFLGWIK